MVHVLASVQLQERKPFFRKIKVTIQYYLLCSARPKTANFPISSLGSNFNPQVSEVRDSEILNVFLRLRLSPASNLKKFAGFRSDTMYETITCIRYNSGLLPKVQALVMAQDETDLKEWGARL